AVPPPRAETAAERMALTARARGAPVAAPTAATLAAATVAGTAPAPAAGNPLATAAAAAAGEPAAARRLQGLPGVERGMPAARNVMAGVYTGEGPHRRGLRRTLKALPGGLAGLLSAMG